MKTDASTTTSQHEKNYTLSELLTLFDHVSLSPDKSINTIVEQILSLTEDKCTIHASLTIRIPDPNPLAHQSLTVGLPSQRGFFVGVNGKGIPGTEDGIREGNNELPKTNKALLIHFRNAEWGGKDLMKSLGQSIWEKILPIAENFRREQRPPFATTGLAVLDIHL